MPCSCYRCVKEAVEADPQPGSFGDPRMMRMFLCETCGNKRCPHAADHRNACSNSNAPGQKGSLYEDAPVFRDAPVTGMTANPYPIPEGE